MHLLIVLGVLLAVLLLLVGLEAGRGYVNVLFSFELPTHYFRPSGLSYPPSKEPFLGRGIAGRWSRGLLRDLFTTNLRIPWRGEEIQAAIDHVFMTSHIELHMLVLRVPRHSAVYQQSLLEFQRLGLSSSKSGRCDSLCIFPNCREFVILLGRGLLKVGGRKDLDHYKELLSRHFSGGEYTEGVLSLIQLFENV